MPSLIHRVWANRTVPSAILAAVVPFVFGGGLELVWAAAGLVASIVWAATRPLPAPEPTPRPAAGQASGQTEARAAAITSIADKATVETLPLSLLDALPDAAVLLDQRGHVITGNAAAQSIAPLPIGRPLSQWTRVPELLSAADKASRTMAQQRCNIRLFTPIERSLEALVTPIPNPAEPDKARNLLVILRDLTEQEQLSRMRVDFVANASHELRTPLTSLRGFIETLQGAAKDDPAAQARFLGIMQTQAERMSRLIDDLLSLSRIEMREHVAPTAVVDLSGVASDVMTALRPTAEKAGIALRGTPNEAPMQAIGDRDELAQVVQNLVQNAIKYGRRGGSVEVSIRREDAQMVLEVRDDGIGIAPEHLPRLTERFYRVSAKDSKERGGTGLGLAIVKHIVNRHRGELQISSTPGQGSTFAVELPAATGRR